MRSLICASAFVMALVAMTTADTYNLHPAKTAQAPWELSKVQRKVNLQETIEMNIALKRKNVDLLEKILLEVSDPQHPNYGEHLNDQQMRELISPGADAVDAVKTHLDHGAMFVDEIDAVDCYDPVHRHAEVGVKVRGPV